MSERRAEAERTLVFLFVLLSAEEGTASAKLAGCAEAMYVDMSWASRAWTVRPNRPAPYRHAQRA